MTGVNNGTALHRAASGGDLVMVKRGRSRNQLVLHANGLNIWTRS
jgi:hypothetical protein